MFYGWADRSMRNCSEKYLNLVAQASQPVQTTTAGADARSTRLS
jgi:hypothetical protein